MIVDEEGIEFIARYQKRGWRKDWVKALTGEATAATVEKEIDPDDKPASGEYSFVAVRREEGSLDIDRDDSDDSDDNYSISAFADDHDDFEQTEFDGYDEYLHETNGGWHINVTNIKDGPSEDPR